MQVSYGLPTHRVDREDEFLVPGAIGELASPPRRPASPPSTPPTIPSPATPGWPTAATTPSTRWWRCPSPPPPRRRSASTPTCSSLAYRNPFIAAKGIASLDVLSGGRVILGIGTGYLEAEFEALGAPFDDRNERTDLAIAAMRAAWVGAEHHLRRSGLPGHGEHHAAEAASATRTTHVDRSGTAVGPFAGRSSRLTGGHRSPIRPGWRPELAPRPCENHR